MRRKRSCASCCRICVIRDLSVMGRNAFETAVDVIDEGYEGQLALDEWMARIEALGQRYCALALDLILSQAQVGQYADEPEPSLPTWDETAIAPAVEGIVQFTGVPGEPLEY